MTLSAEDLLNREENKEILSYFFNKKKPTSVERKNVQIWVKNTFYERVGTYPGIPFLIILKVNVISLFFRCVCYTRISMYQISVLH